ncbi:MAG: hypothetical protein EXR07_01330 [Acetobacteraceae bacterium]|nr:hypothetical protein [Acetobacteraceae bacterium]
MPASVYPRPAMVSWAFARVAPRFLAVSLEGATLTIVPCLLLSLLYWGRPELLLTSDSLTPTDFIWDLLHHGDAWAGFEQPHSPGFFPDETVVGIVQAVTGSWRVAMAAWVLVVLLWLVTAGSAIAAHIAQCTHRTATLAVLALVLPLMTTAALYSSDMHPGTNAQGIFFSWILTLLPGGHGGNFLLALTAALVASRAAKHVRVRDIACLTFLSFAGEVSDQLSLISLLAPVTAALLGGLLAGTIRKENAIRLLTCVWFGAALGGFCASKMDRQYMPHPSFDSFLEHAGRFLAELGDHLDVIAAMLVLTIALAVLAWRDGLRLWPGGFWPVFAAVSSFGSLAFTAIFYEDVWSFRYALPLLWWAVIFAATLLVKAGPWWFWASRGWVAAMAAGLAMVWVSAGAQVPRLLTWSTPLASCLREAGLQAGLADFWIARQTSIASDWSLQIGALNAFGAARIWGNDRLWFTHDIHDGTRRPPYRFIVTDRLPVERLSAAYGEPDRVMMCGNSTVWVFNDSAKLFRDLGRASPFLSELFAAAPPE